MASSREGASLLLIGLGLALAASVAAPSHMRLLVFRSRWLLLTLLVMFGWLTPGAAVPDIPGASYEGLMLAAANLARLLGALAVVAMILKALSPPELVSGMRTLLAPLALLKIPRDRIAVRLALTLSEVEESGSGDGRASGYMTMKLSLPASAMGMTDVGIGVLTGALALGTWLT